jgi:hypothetical protein
MHPHHPFAEDGDSDDQVMISLRRLPSYERSTLGDSSIATVVSVSTANNVVAGRPLTGGFEAQALAAFAPQPPWPLGLSVVEAAVPPQPPWSLGVSVVEERGASATSLETTNRHVDPR